MILANGKPKFKTSHIEPTWSAEIETIGHLKNHMLNTILVSLDIEACRGAVSELGLAMLAVNEDNPHYCIGRSRFFDENNVQALTIDFREKPTRNYEHKRHGQTLQVKDEHEASVIMEKTLSEICDGKKLILLGYDMYTEFQWISERRPAMALYFSAWIDVQELIARKCSEPQLSLTNALRALEIIDNRHGTTRHSAANDAVRIVAVLAGLLKDKTPVIERPIKPSVLRYTKVPSRRDCGAHTKYLFSARIATKDYELLPKCTLADLCKAYAIFDLKAVDMNSCKNKPIRIWWFAFNTLKSLEDFVHQVHGTKMNGEELKVVWTTGVENEAETGGRNRYG